jgi:hypothetical protein
MDGRKSRCGVWSVHLGMKFRIFQHDWGNGLVLDAEGEVVNIVFNPLDQREVEADVAVMFKKRKKS